MRVWSVLAVVSLIAVCGGTCSAAVMTYQDRSQFLSAFSQSTAQTADFNSFTQDVRFIPSVGPADAGPYSLSVNRILASSENLLPNRRVALRRCRHRIRTVFLDSSPTVRKSRRSSFAVGPRMAWTGALVSGWTILRLATT